MYNWSVDAKEFKKNKNEYAVWRLEQMVNFGLGNEKINRCELKKFWQFLNLDKNKKKYLSFLLWPNQFSTPAKKDYPFMKIKIDHEDWQNYFIAEAKKFENKILK